MYVSKPVIFVIISVLVVALIYSSTSAFIFAVKRADPTGAQCSTGTTAKGPVRVCCWGPVGNTFCQTCRKSTTDTETQYSNCEPPIIVGRQGASEAGEGILPGEGVLEQPPSPPTSRTPGQSVLPGEGVLEQPPTPSLPTPRTPGQGVLPQDGILEQQQQQQPTDQGAGEQLTEEPVPACPEGQILDEESGLCVLEEQQEEPEVQESEEESEQGEPEENGGDN